MPATFVTSDLHLSHEKTASVFTLEDGVTPLRPFKDAAEMDEALITRWNDRVRPNDKVYVLGDVAIKHQALHLLGRMNGKKCLVRGNHDVAKLKQYLKYFYNVYGCRVLDGMILTHIPIHPESVGRFKTNVHGHLHAKKIELPSGWPDPRYLNVCVEQTNFTPLTLEEVRARIVKQNEDAAQFTDFVKYVGSLPR